MTVKVYIRIFTYDEMKFTKNPSCSNPKLAKIVPIIAANIVARYGLDVPWNLGSVGQSGGRIMKSTMSAEEIAVGPIAHCFDVPRIV